MDQTQQPVLQINDWLFESLLKEVVENGWEDSENGFPRHVCRHHCIVVPEAGAGKSMYWCRAKLQKADFLAFQGDGKCLLRQTQNKSFRIWLDLTWSYKDRMLHPFQTKKAVLGPLEPSRNLGAATTRRSHGRDMDNVLVVSPPAAVKFNLRHLETNVTGTTLRSWQWSLAFSTPAKELKWPKTTLRMHKSLQSVSLVSGTSAAGPRITRWHSVLSVVPTVVVHPLPDKLNRWLGTIVLLEHAQIAIQNAQDTHVQYEGPFSHGSSAIWPCWRVQDFWWIWRIEVRCFNCNAHLLGHVQIINEDDVFLASWWALGAVHIWSRVCLRETSKKKKKKKPLRCGRVAHWEG